MLREIMFNITSDEPDVTPRRYDTIIPFSLCSSIASNYYLINVLARFYQHIVLYL